MERSQVLDVMSQLKLYGMKAAYDEIITTAAKRQHEPQRIVGDLLTAEIREKQARSIKYQMTIARLPLAKEIDEFLEQQRNVVLTGGTGKRFATPDPSIDDRSACPSGATRPSTAASDRPRCRV